MTTGGSGRVCRREHSLCRRHVQPRRLLGAGEPLFAGLLVADSAAWFVDPRVWVVDAPRRRLCCQKMASTGLASHTGSITILRAFNSK